MADSKGSRLSGAEFESAVGSLFAPLRVADSGSAAFEAVVEHTVLGPVVVARIRATPATVIRDRHHITSTDVELMHLTLLHGGPVAVAQDDRVAALKPGELFACDNTRPYRIIGTAPSDMTVLCVPRASLGKQADAIGRRTALPLSAQDGIGRLLGYALTEVNGDLPGQAVVRAYVADALTALLLAAFADTAPERAPVASDLADRIRVHVLAHLDDPLLTAERVARHHRISLRHLHALFQGADLTFTAWLRHERLRRIRRDLLDPAFSNRSTAAIAARWGILDTKHLGRALRREFGETVSDLRRRRGDS
ncbi:helix-turn-helix domain-containing protein [Streptomyces sp. NPDC047072]|uniref:AraC-like ligand-binding domain-containing protein n=1 Tax=Streptomyces sp. NPDC047072 TaxID=3154809 RepID=UPI0033DA820F